MRLNIKTKQVLGVTSTVGAVVIALSVYHLGALARLSLEESRARGLLLARAIYQRAQGVAPRASDAYEALRQDAGLKSILESSIYSRDVTDAAIVDPDGRIVAHYDSSQIDRVRPPRQQVDDLLAKNALRQVLAIFTDPGRELEVREPLMLGARQFGAIRIGISTLLVRRELERALRPAIGTVLGALIVATAVAMLLAQLFLRPIHVLKSGLTRLQRGETGITFDLPKDEFGDLGVFFSAVSNKLSADRSELAGQKANLETVVERLEDAVAIFNGSGELLFANPAMRALDPRPDDPGVTVPEEWRELVQKTLATRQSRGPVSVRVRSGAAEHEGEWLVSTHVVQDVDQRLIGVMLTGRNLEALGKVQSTLSYSSKLSALGRLSAGVAHEVKNPLNAMMIHLELLRQKLSGTRPALHGTTRAVANPTRTDMPPVATVDVPVDLGGALEHVSVISNEIKRLDQVLQGFLRFTRPEDLRLQPVDPAALLDEVARVIQAETPSTGVRVEVNCHPTTTPYVNGDAGMLRQAILNLGLNACQAMPNGGVLRFAARGASRGRVELSVEDTGTGIAPEHLERIFDLYFTTRQKGSGIGLSMVYRTVQLHNGDIEVQSTPGVGTTFRVLLPEA